MSLPYVLCHPGSEQLFDVSFRGADVVLRLKRYLFFVHTNHTFRIKPKMPAHVGQSRRGLAAQLFASPEFRSSRSHE
jgi:hypothetical protein